jgi:hypothetical protein
MAKRFFSAKLCVMARRFCNEWDGRTSARMKLDWCWEASTDDGKTWRMNWPSLYERAR